MHDISEGFAYGNGLPAGFSVVLVLALVCSYFTPKRKIEWLPMGVLSAWVVALFTEMFRFLLTVYLRVLTRVRPARREEREVSEKFGERYLAYRARTPAFIPAWSSLRRHATALETRV